MRARNIAGPAAAAAALAACLVAAGLGAAAPAADPWPYLPNDDIGAPAFKAAHPTYDGRGVIVAVLDTGVDAFAPGLRETSTGGVKLIEVRDFSTEGEWHVAEAETVGGGGAGVWRHPDGLRLRGADRLAVPPAVDDLEHPVYVGIIPEARFLNSRGVQDLNDDGDTSDRFGFLVWLADRSEVERELGLGRGYEFLQGLNETAAATVARERRGERVWLVAVDTDGDGDLAGEPILRDYRVNWDTFRLTDESAPESRTMMAWEVNVRDEEDRLGRPQPPTVEFHFDDGAHGSHVAGIAAGYQVGGQPTLDGVAPGAWLASLKIGDNRLAGGASRTESMKKAYQYAAELAESYGVPVVCNMSYGIASVEEGEDRMGRWLDDFLAEHPKLVCCTSAGNEGPGVSTIGLPATSAALISSGAYLSVATGSDLYNARLTQPTLFAFSSRGGEVAKPDVVSPGSALSTVPGWVDGSARFNGTSMASPQTAGAVACLLSAADQEGLAVHWGMVKRALIGGARRVPGLGLLDQGGGLVQLEPSWGILRELAASRSAHEVLWYDIETACPFQADGTSDAAYWRTPGGAPVAPERITFRVRPIFNPDLTPDQKDGFFRSFDLKSEAGWLRVLPGKSYIRGDMAMEIDLQYEGDELDEPGVHAARVIGSLDGGDLHGIAAREFALWNSVVVGEPSGPERGYLRTWRGKDLPPSVVARHFVDVPPAASAMRVRLEVGERSGAVEGARALTEVCDPEGHVHGEWTGFASPEGDQVKETILTSPELRPGTWEVDVVAAITAMAPTDYLLSVAFDGYDWTPATISGLARPAAGGAAETELTVTRAFEGVFKGGAEARLEGFLRREEVEVEKAEEWTYSFTLDRQTPRVDFRLEMDEKTVNLFTDAAVNILDADGRAIVTDGFNGPVVKVGTRLPAGVDDATYTLQVVGGFALKEDSDAWGFDLEERRRWADPVAGEVEHGGGGELRLYAGVPVPLTVRFDESWPTPPEGDSVFGAVRFLDRDLPDRVPGEEGGVLVLEVPIVTE